MPIAKSNLGFAGQPGYAIREGETVSIVPADNLPQGGYFVRNDQTGESIHVDEDELDDFVEEDEDRIEDDDWVTHDGGATFYQSGRLRLDATDMTKTETKRAIARIMAKDRYWPNIWSVSDHGNFWLWGA